MKVTGVNLGALLFSLLYLLCSCLAANTRVINVKAPMPGKIVKTFVRERSHVVSGDCLLTMEAMKLHHNIQAPFSDGEQARKFRILRVHVTEDAMVDMGDNLVTLEVM